VSDRCAKRGRAPWSHCELGVVRTLAAAAASASAACCLASFLAAFLAAFSSSVLPIVWFRGDV
jgi:hypothetical protein